MGPETDKQPHRQTTSAALGIVSYLSAALETDAGLSSVAAAIATNSAVQSSVEAWAETAAAALTTGSLTAVPTVNFDGLPTEVKGPISSALNAYSNGVVSIATANGFSVSGGSAAATGSAGAKSSGAASGTSKGAASSSASQAGAEPTGRALGAAAGVAMGFVGLIAAL